MDRPRLTMVAVQNARNECLWKWRRSVTATGELVVIAHYSPSLHVRALLREGRRLLRLPAMSSWTEAFGATINGTSCVVRGLADRSRTSGAFRAGCSLRIMNHDGLLEKRALGRTGR